MEVILKNDVENLGFTDDTVSVKNGYGRNYLIPQGHAVLATVSAKKVLAEKLKQRAYKEKKIVESAQVQADKLNGLEIKLTAKTGEGDKLFGSITSADVAEALAKEGVEIEKKFISVAGGNIKRTGQ
ncbi:MAG: large subunit ribosomal protein L9, partial [Patiriisocius sp.]